MNWLPQTFCEWAVHADPNVYDGYKATGKIQFDLIYEVYLHFLNCVDENIIIDLGKRADDKDRFDNFDAIIPLAGFSNDSRFGWKGVDDEPKISVHSACLKIRYDYHAAIPSPDAFDADSFLRYVPSGADLKHELDAVARSYAWGLGHNPVLLWNLVKLYIDDAPIDYIKIKAILMIAE